MYYVELIPAHLWTCPECGRDNFERCVTFEADAETMKEAKEKLGVEPWEDGVLLSAPQSVVCRACGGVYQTIEFME